MAIYLPFEILTAIFEQVDNIQDLRHVRSASHTLCAAATPFAFRVLSVTSTERSAQNLRWLLNVPEIAAHVREVAYRDSGADKRRLMQSLKEIRNIAIPQLASFFSCIHQLPRLDTINLTFFPANGHRLDLNSKGRHALQASILGALAESFSILATSSLTSLSLHNLRTWDLTPLDSPPFQTVLRTLRRLQLSVIYDYHPDIDIAFDRWLHFWGTFCSSKLLTITQHSLTELTLHSDTFIGASFDFSFDGLHFPCLCAISLQKLVFEPSIGVEPFILRHAVTLSRLELMECNLPLDADGFFPPSTTLASDGKSSPRPTYWECIWDSFAAELTALVALHVDDRPKFHPSSRCGYVLHGVAVFYCEIRAPAHLDKSDAVALRRFYMTVAARSEACRAA